MQRIVLIIVLSFFFLVLGYTAPGVALLDVPFALAFFLIDLIGLWDPSPLWVEEHNLLNWLCAFVWPLLVSFLYSFLTLRTASKIRDAEAERHHLLVAIIMIVVLGLIIMAHTLVGMAPISFHNYWTTNY